MNKTVHPLPLYKNRIFWLGFVSISLILSLLLTWISTGFQTLAGWNSFLAAFILAGGLLGVGLWLVRKEDPPRWLLILLLIAVALRLVVGAIWFLALPVLGHGSPGELAGYIMADASDRDVASQELADTSKPLLSAFSNNRKTDQYGGMLFFSALIYRYLGAERHFPLLIVIFSATVSALTVLFTWAFAMKAWGGKKATIAAWIVTLFPEAVLLGSSQMREAFIMAFTMAAFYGLLLFYKDRSTSGLMWIIIALVFCLPFSPLYTALLFGSLLVLSIPMRRDQPHKYAKSKGIIWLILALGALLIIAGLWLALRQFVPHGMTNPVAMLSWWLRKSASMQAHLTKQASGWMQQIYRITPEWSHLPMLLIYGVVQPFLPAALVTGSLAPIWHWIAIWRAVGWVLLLPFLIYAPLRAIRKKDEGGFTLVLILVVWAGILIASFRGGGDLWDNPRYRAVFIGLQASVAAWAIIEDRRISDPWLHRTVISMGIILAWFIPWYLQRYTSFPWPIGDLFSTIGLGIISASIYIIWDWSRMKGSHNNQNGERIS